MPTNNEDADPYPTSGRASDDAARKDRMLLVQAVESAAHLLPAQGPISVFIHHNTLHAFEHLPFEEAVVEAGRIYGCQPYLSEDRYRAEIRRGRILDHDIRAALNESLGEDGTRKLGRFCSRFELRYAMLAQGLTTLRPAELRWMLSESDALKRFRPDAPDFARHHVIEGFRHAMARDEISRKEETDALIALWDACVRVGDFPVAPPVTAPRWITRHRDRLLKLTSLDSDALVHPLLIRVCAAFLDQGLAYWPMPDRERGLFHAVLDLYADGNFPKRDWLAEFATLAKEDRDAGRDADVSALYSLRILGVGAPEWGAFIAETLLVLRGWAGMVDQFEQRPDRAPGYAPPSKILDYLALRLLMERAALTHSCRVSGLSTDLSELRHTEREEPDPGPTTADRALQRAWVIFQLSQLIGRSAREVDTLRPMDAAQIFREVERFGDTDRRRLLHRAYERRYRVEILDALARHSAAGDDHSGPARFQAVFCIDEREESIRRHLEEVAPEAETLGYAGFFGVAMYYRGAEDARPRPLCPVVIQPTHEIEERFIESTEEAALRQRVWRSRIGRLRRGYDVGSRTFTRGALFSALLGSFAAVPLLIRVLFPRTAAAIRSRSVHLFQPVSKTRLSLDHQPDAAPMLGRRMGYEVEEMSAIVARMLRETGMAGRLSGTVVIVGHGSSSLNNPHESAHDCGACGGGRGGPNGRAFAQMANDPRVRKHLAESGCPIPDETLFVGAEHNSCNDSVTFYDLDLVPEDRRGEIDAIRLAFTEACKRNAHERCRRFDNAELNATTDAALAHVEARTEDLAQPRPEYGHATNAVCFVGRRSITRGLFLDRRAFLVSYDSLQDDADSRTLEANLAAVVPVCAGINLEYYFSFVDPTGYGCGTKLPHNISAMLGVMDGHASDLRTGLPWQMVEIHEPVRLLMIVEGEPASILRVLERLPSIHRLVQNGWIRLVARSPRAGELHVFNLRMGGFIPHHSDAFELPVVSTSAEWYRGRRAHLRCARIDREAAGAAPANGVNG